MKIIRSTKRLTLSNVLTLLRIIATPCIVALLVHGWLKATVALFAFAALTDLFDGYLARRWNEHTVLGSYLDPIADKVLVLSCFATLFYLDISVLLPRWFLLLVLVREVIIISGAFFVRLRYGSSYRIEPTMSGKLTAAGYMVLIGWILMCHFFSWMPIMSVGILLIALSCLAFISLAHYVARSISLLSQ